MIKNLTIGSTYVDLYAATGITVGTKIKIQICTATGLVQLGVKATAPTSDQDGVIYARPGEWLINSAGDPGAWARCDGTALVAVISE